MRREDLLDNLGFADVPADVADATAIMAPGALRGAARGHDLDSLTRTLFLRIYPVIAAVVLLTQAGIAWVNYTDQIRLYTDRANILASLTASAIARPGWERAPEIFGPQLQALARDPAFRYAALRDGAGTLLGSAGERPQGRDWNRVQVSATLDAAGDRSGNLTLVLSAEALRDNAERQALLALGTSLVLMLAFVATLNRTVRRHVVAPLKRLLVAMRKVEHKRWTTVDLGGAYRPSNEIDAISQAFNSMVEGLQSGDEAKRLLQALEQAHAQLETANRQVIESIGYARRIQASVLPERTALGGSVALAVLYQPLHLVGGDYYWLEEIDGLSVIVVADCTGHGVPGAFLTLIVATALDRLLHERGLRSPAAILAGLDAMVRAQLRQDGRGAESDDGLDCGICVWDPAGRSLLFAGAGLSLTAIRDGAVAQVRGGRRGLGYPRTGREALPEADTPVAVEPGTTFYLMTDGVTDQMGGAPGERPRLMGQRGVAERLLARADDDLDAQLAGLEQDLAAYRGSQPRRDDMTLVAFRLP
ncbi:serine/threonine protein phosphatase [Methylobacterium radiodurans]|uniref:Serine/threonine protein phosphatase n=2 Tax=Methylobacterium radiodurans TaxID=2202828 RepID=A0A2U8VZC9_9HYPH|nr:serine/threonine protein phosphatase [Methylobacterium radiodurans]